MKKTQNEIEERVRRISEEAHVKWLSKCKTATINGNEMTVLPYGYFQTAVKEVLREAIREAREEGHFKGFKEGLEAGRKINKVAQETVRMAREAGRKEGVRELWEKIPDLDKAKYPSLKKIVNFNKS